MLEVKQILESMDADVNLQMAGLLFSTIGSHKDKLDIRKKYGDDVANLVLTHNRYMREAWRVLDKLAFPKLAKADKRQQMLALANILVLQQKLLQSYQQVGDKLWQDSDINYVDLSLYLSNLQDALYAMQYYPECEEVYWEMVRTYKQLFISYYYDAAAQRLYQSSPYGEIFVLNLSNPQWDYFNDKIPQTAKPVSCKLAETIEDISNEPFWEMHTNDISDNTYDVCLTEEVCSRILIKDGNLSFAYTDYSRGTEEIYTLDEENTYRFLARFRIVYGVDKSLEVLLKEVFAKENGNTIFNEFCKKEAVYYTSSCTTTKD